jgi:hypothetical protein
MMGVDAEMAKIIVLSIRVLSPENDRYYARFEGKLNLVYSDNNDLSTAIQHAQAGYYVCRGKR